MKTNLVELASDLADIVVHRIAVINNEEPVEEIRETIYYTEKYQDIFNDLYDRMYFLLEEDFEHENN